MTVLRTPWSWTAFAASTVIAGVCLMLTMLVILLLREGTGTDVMVPMSATSYWIFGIVQCCLISMAVIALARWLGNRSKQPARRFLDLAMAIPVVLLLVAALLSLSLEGVNGLPLFDPRRWMEVVAFPLVFYLAGRIYLAVAKRNISGQS